MTYPVCNLWWTIPTSRQGILIYDCRCTKPSWGHTSVFICIRESHIIGSRENGMWLCFILLCLYFQVNISLITMNVYVSIRSFFTLFNSCINQPIKRLTLLWLHCSLFAILFAISYLFWTFFLNTPPGMEIWIIKKTIIQHTNAVIN